MDHVCHRHERGRIPITDRGDGPSIIEFVYVEEIVEKFTLSTNTASEALRPD